MCWCAKAERTVYSSSKKLGILICHFDLKFLGPAAWLPDVSVKKQRLVQGFLSDTKS